MCLSKYEKETILLTSEGDDFYDIQVYDSKLKRKLTEFAAKDPDLLARLLTAGLPKPESKVRRVVTEWMPKPVSDSDSPGNPIE